MATGISESMLRTIENQAEEIKDSFRSAIRRTTSKITQIKSPVAEKKKQRGQWIEIKNQCNFSCFCLMLLFRLKFKKRKKNWLRNEMLLSLIQEFSFFTFFFF